MDIVVAQQVSTDVPRVLLGMGATNAADGMIAITAANAVIIVEFTILSVRHYL